MSPRATPTEEPDGGNLLVRIWRGAGVGNLPAYSTKSFFVPAPREHPRVWRSAAPYAAPPSAESSDLCGQ
jgi:hypothetical protein